MVAAGPAVVATCLLILCTPATAVDLSDFYPFGVELDDSLSASDDASSSVITLSIPIVFYGQRKYTLSVNTNGHISFGNATPAYVNRRLPLGYDAIHAFYADFDNRVTGDVFYRESTDPKLLGEVAARINRAFALSEPFQPLSVFIATWDKVGSYDSQFDKVNTLQAAIASNGFDSYTIFLYAEDGIQWVKAMSKQTGASDELPAQVGFDGSSRGYVFTLPVSGTPEVESMATSSNVGVPGAWLFHMGNVRLVTEPPRSSGLTAGGAPSYTVNGTCRIHGVAACHTKASCQDHERGFCCSCNSNYNGNGLSCIENGVPQRVNGKLTLASLEGAPANRLDTHTYVITSEGKTYTGMSKISPSVGYSTQLLFVLGEVAGWLYADRQGGHAPNGFTLTGGAFNYNATLMFSSGETVEIRQQYSGTNQLNYVGLSTVVEGRVPKLPDGAEVQIPVHDVTYYKFAPGGIRSSSTKTVLVNKQDRLTVLVEETIHYNECPGNVYPIGFLHTIHHHGYSVIYDENDLTVRYNLVSAVRRHSVDLCNTSNCDINANCEVVSPTSYTCKCKAGYTGSGQVCEDVDECTTGQFECKANSFCINTMGSYICHCNSGYELNNTVCVQKQATCDSYVCDSNAFCTYDQNQRPRCQCFDGYEGNGQRCTQVVPCVECHTNAQCIPDSSRLGYKCICTPGHVGDGRNCAAVATTKPTTSTAATMTTTAAPLPRPTTVKPQPAVPGQDETCFTRPALCDLNAQCTFTGGNYACVCREGYLGDGRRCARAECTSHSQCGDNGQCHYDRDQMKYRCKCREGFASDGRRCIRIGEKTCNEIRNCDANARCIEGAQGPQCVCNDGFEGNGYACKKRQENCRTKPEICDRNAQCVLTAAGDAVCFCSPGFAGDGLRCVPAQDSGNYLLMAQGPSLLQIPLSSAVGGDKGKRLLYRQNETIIGVAIDCRDRYVFWSDIVTKTISRATLGSPNDITVIVRGLSSPEGLAVDWVSRNLYWTDSGFDRIEVSRLDGSHRKVLINKGLVNPRAIQVDPIRGKLYWADWNRAAPKIEVANLDGSNRQTLVDKNLGLPNGLAFDPYRQEICWADAGTQRVECVRADGTERRTIFHLASYPFALTTFRDVFYWTDWSIMSVQSKSRQGTQLGESLIYPAGGYGRGYGVSAVPGQCFSGSNACAYDNGGCRYLCLPVSQYARTCACPGGATEDDACNDITRFL